MLQAAQDGIDRPARYARRVQVVEAQCPLSAIRLRVEVAADSGDHRSEVKRPEGVGANRP